MTSFDFGIDSFVVEDGTASAKANDTLKRKVYFDFLLSVFDDMTDGDFNIEDEYCGLTEEKFDVLYRHFYTR